MAALHAKKADSMMPKDRSGHVKIESQQFLSNSLIAVKVSQSGSALGLGNVCFYEICFLLAALNDKIKMIYLCSQPLRV